MVYSYPESVNGWVEAMGGEAFCANPDLDLGVDVEQCKENMAKFMPLALRALDSTYVANAQAICNKWYEISSVSTEAFWQIVGQRGINVKG